MRTKHFVFAVATAISAFVSTSCAPKQKEQVIVAQGPSAYDKYKQEIATLPQKAITLRTIPSDNAQEPYVVAVENTTSYSAAVTDLQKRILGDLAVNGSATTGQKAELLLALQQEQATRAPLYLAPEINKKARELVIQQFSIYGKEAMKRPGVMQVVLAFRGVEGLRQLSSDNAGYDLAQTVLYPQSHVIN